MSVNIKKTKVLVFNKAGRIKNIEIKFKEQNIECVQQYTYLGVVFAASGSFSRSVLGLGMSVEKDFLRLNMALTPLL
jgi:hypothetical protein